MAVAVNDTHRQSAKEQKDFTSVTEIAGESVSRYQVESLVRRYQWASTYCAGKDVLEAACGSGSGLRYLSSIAHSLTAGDYSEAVLQRTRESLAGTVEVSQFDAQEMPFSAAVFDVVIMFEAIYYLPSANRFMEECRRVLRPGGTVLIATANKDLFDFNPSPYSYTYYGVIELAALCRAHGFEPSMFAGAPAGNAGVREKILRLAKKLAVSLNLIPKTMAGKKLLKRFVFGSLVPMPASITDVSIGCAPPVPISAQAPDNTHKVIYCAAKLTQDCN